MSIKTKIGMFGNPSSEFFIGENELDLLSSDSARSASNYWELRENELDSLAQKVEKLFVVSNGGFTFQATWSGEDPVLTSSMSIGEFLDIIKDNRISKTTKYIVVGSV